MQNSKVLYKSTKSTTLRKKRVKGTTGTILQYLHMEKSKKKFFSKSQILGPWYFLCTFYPFLIFGLLFAKYWKFLNMKYFWAEISANLENSPWKCIIFIFERTFYPFCLGRNFCRISKKIFFQILLILLKNIFRTY